MSNPVWVSCNNRKAWCGRFAELPSWVVKVTRNVSAPESETALDSGLDEENLEKLSVSFEAFHVKNPKKNPLFLESAVDPSALGLNCHGGISKAPTGRSSRGQSG